MVTSRPMPALAAPLFGLSLGVLFAWAGAEEIARAHSSSSRSLVVAALFGAIVYAPACGYFQAFFPDWAFAYYLDAQHRGLAVDLGLVLANALSVPLGLAMVARSAAARRAGTLTRAAVIPAALAVILVLALSTRLRVVSTFAQFHGDFGTEPLVGSALAWALLWMALIVAGAVVWTLHVLRRLAAPARTN